MKSDKFLIGIVAGIGLLVVVAIVVVLTRGQMEDYVADDSPAGVSHNYFLAIQRQNYNKAYSYLADDIESKPNLDQFIITIDNFSNRAEASLQLGESSIDDNRARVEVSITTYRGGGPFDSGSYTNRDTAHLRRTADGHWKLIEFPHPYWGYDWNKAKD